MSSPNTFTVRGVTSSADGSFLNTATVTVTIEDSGDTPLSGTTWPLTMSNIAGSNGDYSVALPVSVALAAGLTYIAAINIDADTAGTLSYQTPFQAPANILTLGQRTSGTYSFAPSSAEAILQAYRRLGVPRTAIDQDKLFDGRMELNAIASDWANKGPSLWTVDSQSVALTAGTATLSIDPATVDLLDVWITVAGVDRPLAAISRSDYAAQPNKALQGVPTSFWLDKLTVPTLTLWPVPDSNGPYTLSYFRFRQMADATLPGAATPDVPFRFLDALIWDLAARLSYAHAPDKTAALEARSARAWDAAAATDIESAPMTFAPLMGGYFR